MRNEEKMMINRFRGPLVLYESTWVGLYTETALKADPETMLLPERFLLPARVGVYVPGWP